MADEKQADKEKNSTVDILVECVPDYLYGQIRTAAEQTGQTIHEWIIGACHMRYSSQFRDNLLYAGKGEDRAGGSGGPVI
jgi:hypothetical protein